MTIVQTGSRNISITNNSFSQFYWNPVDHSTQHHWGLVIKLLWYQDKELSVFTADRAKIDTIAKEERQIKEENIRLQRKLLREMERREALSRQLSESESSIEMDDERSVQIVNIW